MASPIRQIRDSIQRVGITKTVLKVVGRPFELIRRKIAVSKILSLPTPEERFTWIYENDYWQSKESVSGTGSTLKYTANLRKELPPLFSKFGIQSILDAPCGDFNWMSRLLAEVDVRYIGGDIVKPLIRSLNERHGSDRVSFVHLDLISGTFPSADLMICRDCLFHLSYADTQAVLKNFIASGIPYLLTTSHKNNGTVVNCDIQTGSFRVMDLFASPYNFPTDPLVRIDDWVAPDPEREMCLWRREQVASALAAFGR
jgi:SAM-dependent methyltransferase